jgi:hypothetical protein
LNTCLFLLHILHQRLDFWTLFSVELPSSFGPVKGQIDA